MALVALDSELTLGSESRARVVKVFIVFALSHVSGKAPCCVTWVGILGEASPRESHGRMGPRDPPKTKKIAIMLKRKRDDISEEHMRTNRLIFFLSFKAKMEISPVFFTGL